MTLLTAETIQKNHIEEWKQDALKQFEEKLGSRTHLFPCIPATQGLKLNQFRYGFISDPRHKDASKELARLLRDYSEQSKSYGPYTSLIVFYETNEDLRKRSIEDLEELFWSQLSQVSEWDDSLWPEDCPVDPHNPLWEFCFHKERYFMYCATPAHQNRKSRAFPYLMLAITPRWVLEHFHETPHHSERIKTKIRERLERYDKVPAHPHLNSYGAHNNYEWQQYFLYDDETSLSECPFHKR